MTEPNNGQAPTTSAHKYTGTIILRTRPHTYKRVARGLTQRIALGGDGKRFIVRAEDILTAFLELQRAIHAFAVSLIS